MSDLISNIKVNTAPVSQQAAKVEKEPEKKQEEQKIDAKTKGQIMLGAAGLAAMSIAGILLKGKVAAKVPAGVENAVSQSVDNITELVNTMRRNLSFKRNDENFCKFFDPDIIQKYIDDAMNLSGKEKADRITKIYKYYMDGRTEGLSISGMANISDLPQDIQNAIKAKDYIKTSKLYGQYCDTIVHKAPTAGATVEESIKNVFAKASEKIKPHTYDMAKESDNIVIMDNYGGFRTTIVNKQNQIINPDINRSLGNLGYEDFITKPSGVLSKGKVIIDSGIKDGKAFTTIKFPSYLEDGVDGNRVSNAITLLSPNAELTPAQKDLLKLKDMSAEDIDLMANLTMCINNKDGYFGGTLINFDAILSFIQTCAQKIK